MAVPKKRTSKSKKNSRLSNWSKKANLQAERALSLAKSILSGETTSFVSKIDQNNN
jgi:large subunit ribosomal protein L32